MVLVVVPPVVDVVLGGEDGFKIGVMVLFFGNWTPVPATWLLLSSFEISSFNL